MTEHKGQEGVHPLAGLQAKKAAERAEAKAAADEERADAAEEKREAALEKHESSGRTSARAAIAATLKTAQDALQAHFDSYAKAWPHLTPDERLELWRRYCAAEVATNQRSASYRGRNLDSDHPHIDYRGEPHPSTNPLLSLFLTPEPTAGPLPPEPQPPLEPEPRRAGHTP
jgi:hypothetical protein